MLDPQWVFADEIIRQFFDGGDGALGLALKRGLAPPLNAAVGCDLEKTGPLAWKELVNLGDFQVGCSLAWRVDEGLRSTDWTRFNGDRVVTIGTANRLNKVWLMLQGQGPGAAMGERVQGDCQPIRQSAGNWRRADPLETLRQSRYTAVQITRPAGRIAIVLYATS